MQDHPDSVPRLRPEVTITDAERRAFAVADELNVHGAGCVCPRCAGRLPALLTELSRAIEQADDRPDAGRRR